MQGQQKLKKEQMHLEVLEEKHKGKQRKGKSKWRKVREKTKKGQMQLGKR